MIIPGVITRENYINAETRFCFLKNQYFRENTFILILFCIFEFRKKRAEVMYRNET